MLAVNGYYDGTTIRALDSINAKKNQKLIITVLDDFMDDNRVETARKSSKGVLAAYANPEYMEQEHMAWEQAVREKYGNA